MLGGQRQVEGQEVGGFPYLSGRLDALGAELTEALLRDEGVVRDDAHPEAESPPRHLLADPAEPEHAQRLALELDATVPSALPTSLLQCGVRLRNVPRERNQQPDRMLAGVADVRLRHVG